MALQPQQLFTNFVQRFNQLPTARKMGLVVGVAAAFALIVGLFLWSGAPEYRVLFSNLSEKDAGAVTATLQQMNVPYRAEPGGTLTVPAEQVYDLRFKLAAQGLPKGGAVGFEILDTPKLGMTQFQEQLAFQRGLEGELARTIQSLAPVESARVHLAIPKPSVFIRDKQAPSASVLVNLHPGRALDAGQVQSIVHLVSSSVPELSPNNVTLADQAGNLLSFKSDAAMKGLNSSQLDYLRQVESYQARRIEAILEPIVGAGNVKAQVHADLDFSESEATSETFKPNAAQEAQSIRSQQTVDDMSEGARVPQGVPGALTNQPPGPATAPADTTQQQGANAGQNLGQAVGGNSTRKENTVNYELDKTIRHVKEPLGRVKRLSVAVVVNYRRPVADENGQLGKPTPLPTQELTQINDLVKEAMGFNPQRGDTVNVVNAAFTEAKAELEIPLWKDPDTIALAKTLLKNLVVFGLAFYLVFGVLRPLLRDLVKPPEVVHAEAAGVPGAAGVEGMAAEGVAGIPGVRADTYVEIMAKVKEFAKANPKLTADIVKEWMAKE